MYNDRMTFCVTRRGFHECNIRMVHKIQRLLLMEYGKSEGGEVDFVIVRGGKVSALINVSCARFREEVVEREVIGLEKASKEL